VLRMAVPAPEEEGANGKLLESPVRPDAQKRAVSGVAAAAARCSPAIRDRRGLLPAAAKTISWGTPEHPWQGNGRRNSGALASVLRLPRKVQSS